MGNNTETLTTEEAAAELGVTPSRVRQMIRAGELPARRFGKVHVISRDGLKLALSRKTAPGPAAKPKAGNQEKPKKAGKKKGGKK